MVDLMQVATRAAVAGPAEAAVTARAGTPGSGVLRRSATWAPMAGVTTALTACPALVEQPEAGRHQVAVQPVVVDLRRHHPSLLIQLPLPRSLR